ncbi:MAG: Rho termination factor N-terminal domain-containing protein [Bacillota bacterium]|nr:Rho termination factor N-terminal domain-containing protein [Bacillota bacterium]
MIELKRHNVHRLVNTKEKAERLISEGFKVVNDKENLLGLQKNNSEQVDYSTMTTDQLKAMCKDNNLEGYTTKNKEDLIKFIKENIK